MPSEIAENIRRQPLGFRQRMKAWEGSRRINTRTRVKPAEPVTEGDYPNNARMDLITPQAKLFGVVATRHQVRPLDKREWKIRDSGVEYGIRSEYYLGAPELRLLLALVAHATKNPIEAAMLPQDGEFDAFDQIEHLYITKSVKYPSAFVEIKISRLLRYFGLTDGKNNYSRIEKSLDKLALVHMKRWNTGHKTGWTQLLDWDFYEATKNVRVLINPFIARYILPGTGAQAPWTTISMVEIERLSSFDAALPICVYLSGHIGFGNSLVLSVDELVRVAHLDADVTPSGIAKRRARVMTALELINEAGAWTVRLTDRGNVFVQRWSNEETKAYEKRGRDGGPAKFGD